MSCTNGVMQTCVIGQQGCLVLLAKTCSEGCYNDTCASCSTLPQPLLDTEPTVQTANYGNIVLSGDVAITEYRGFSPITGSLTTVGLAPFNVANPAAIVPLGLQQVFANGSIGSLRLVGNRLYFLGPQTLYIYDATNPAAPTALGSLALTATATDLSVDGNRACVAAGDGVHIIDVSNGGAPSQVGLFPANPVPYQVICKGTDAAVLGVNRLQILDLADPTNPQLATQLTLASTVYEPPSLLFDGATVAVQSYQDASDDQLAYSVDTYAFTAPATLAHVGSVGPFGYLADLTSSGTDVGFYTIDSVGVIDLSIPSAPRLAKQTAVYPRPGPVARAGSTLFSTGAALSTFDLTLAPDIVVRQVKDGYLGGVAVQGAIAYYARSGGTLILDDIRNPLAPVELSRIAVQATSVAVRGAYAYVTVQDSTSSAHLVIYDVSDPWLPVQVGSVAGRASSGGGMGRLTLQGDRAYAICDIGYLCVFDVSNPFAPSLIVASEAIVTAAGQSSSLAPFAMSGNILFAPGSGLTPVDLSDPTAPVVGTHVAFNPAPDAIEEVAVDGTHAYVVSHCNESPGNHCTQVIDISDPMNPVVVGTSIDDIRVMADLYPLLTEPNDWSLRVQEGILYLSNAWGAEFVMDVSDPTSPRRINEYWTTYPARLTYQFDRYLLAHLVTSTGNAEQVIEMCH